MLKNIMIAAMALSILGGPAAFAAPHHRHCTTKIQRVHVGHHWVNKRVRVCR